jgi:hypothetical protein
MVIGGYGRAIKHQVLKGGVIKSPKLGGPLKRGGGKKKLLRYIIQTTPILWVNPPAYPFSLAASFFSYSLFFTPILL